MRAVADGGRRLAAESLARSAAAGRGAAAMDGRGWRTVQRIRLWGGRSAGYRRTVGRALFVRANVLM